MSASVRPTPVSQSKGSESSNTNDHTNTLRKFRKDIRGWLTGIFEQIFRIIFFWIKDDKQLGHVIREIHLYSFHAIILWYVILHTFLQSYWLLTSLWMLIGIVWISHMLTGTCVITLIERNLTGEDITIMDPILSLFGMPLTRECRSGFTIAMSTVSFAFLTFELWSRSILNLQAWSYTLLPSAQKTYSYVC
jgi:hypothetical protein